MTTGEDTRGRAGTGIVEYTQEDEHPTPVHRHWLSRNRLLAANAAFTVYATALALDTGHADRTWAIWAAVGYGVTTLILWVTRGKNMPLVVPLLVSLAGALAAPVTWLVTRVAPTAEVQVISRSAVLLLQHGTPYLPQGQLDTALSYNPYLPLMAVFGLPKALGASGLFGDPRLWLTATSIALIWVAFTVAAPHRHCDLVPVQRAAVHHLHRGLPGDRVPARGRYHRPAGDRADVPHPGPDRPAVQRVSRGRGPRGRLRDEGDRLARGPRPGRDAGRPRRRPVGLALRRGSRAWWPSSCRSRWPRGAGQPVRVPAEHRAVPARPDQAQDAGGQPAARAPARHDRACRATGPRSACWSWPGSASRSRSSSGRR